MNRLVFNYPAKFITAVDCSTVDVVIERGFGDATFTRMKMLNQELIPKTAENKKELFQKATDILNLMIMGKRGIIAPSRPNAYGRSMVRIYLPCKGQHPDFPGITALYAGTQFACVNNLMVLAAQHNFNIEFIEKILTVLEIQSYEKFHRTISEEAPAAKSG